MSDLTEEIQLHAHEYYLEEHVEYTPDLIKDICDRLMERAELEGLDNCYLLFKSNFEPYEDLLGNPSIIPCGYRAKTEEELNQETFRGEAAKLANELGTHVTAAEEILRLRKEGKL